jgi:hypothetical protein
MGNWEPHVSSNPKYVELDYKRAFPDAKDSDVPHFTDEELQWMKDLPYTIDIPQYDIMVVHAGLVQGVPLEKQNKQDMVCTCRCVLCVVTYMRALLHR